MRIIGGRHRGTKLAELVGDKTRPTSDRLRETLFNILAGGRFGTPVVDGVVIDLFAGTGAVGLEALSRGATEVAFVENNMAALDVLRSNIRLLNRGDACHVVAGNALTLAGWRRAPATMVFADAPYGTGDGLRAIARLESLGAIDDKAVAVIETGKAETLDVELLAVAGLKLADSRLYGKARLHFLTRG